MTSVDGASVIRPAGAGAGLSEQRAADLTAQIIDLTAASAARPAETIDLDRHLAEPPTTIAAASSDPTTALRAALPVSARGRWRRRYLFVVALGDAGALLLAVILVVGFRTSTLRHVHGPVHRLVVVGGLLALWITGTNFSVSSALGFVALMGVAVLTSVILYSFINKLRLEGKDIVTATYEASLLRLRPIMMTALVACIGLLPAAMSTGIGSDSQKPFAIVIVGGLLSRLLLSIFLAPVLYTLVARPDDVLKV